MPLLDHFHPPLSQRRHWDSFHGAWAEAMAIHLNQDLLPARYYAEARVTVGNRVEIDVATFDDQDQRRDRRRESSSHDDGGVAVWAPSKPAATVPLDFGKAEEFVVQILNDEEGPQVVAAVELISPANKDRQSHRRMFAAKCASYLQQGISLILVDVVTGRNANLQVELFGLLGIQTAVVGQQAAELYASAYRTLSRDKNTMQMEIWAEVLTVGSELPTLPLWIRPDQTVPLDLEQTYRVACTNRRIAV